jgi:hypothetical protein
MALGLNVVMGSPRSIWFWMNARRFRDRQQRGRGWGLNNTRFQSTDRDRGSWGQQLREARTSSSSLYDVDQRGILSVAVEFLFGPTPFDPGPTDVEKWKIREHCIVAVSTRSQGKGVSIAQLLPYSDYPPDIKSVQNQIILGDGKLECLNIISHFNGVPIGSRGVAFIFPELMAESSSVEIQVTMPSNKGPWQAFFFSDDLLQEFSESGQRHDGGQTNGLLEYLQEKYYVLTELSKKQFSQCCILNILNYIGIQMLRTAILKGGTLQIQNRSALSASNGLLSILDFYARLFFAIPLLRGMIIAMLNLRVNQRNDKRKEFAENLTLNL